MRLPKFLRRALTWVAHKMQDDSVQIRIEIDESGLPEIFRYPFHELIPALTRTYTPMPAPAWWDTFLEQDRVFSTDSLANTAKKLFTKLFERLRPHVPTSAIAGTNPTISSLATITVQAIGYAFWLMVSVILWSASWNVYKERNWLAVVVGLMLGTATLILILWLAPDVLKHFINFVRGILLWKRNNGSWGTHETPVPLSRERILSAVEGGETYLAALSQRVDAIAAKLEPGRAQRRHLRGQLRERDLKSKERTEYRQALEEVEAALEPHERVLKDLQRLRGLARKALQAYADVLVLRNPEEGDHTQGANLGPLEVRQREREERSREELTRAVNVYSEALDAAEQVLTETSIAGEPALAEAYFEARHVLRGRSS